MTTFVFCSNIASAEDTEQPVVEETQNVEVLDYDTQQKLNEDAFATDTIYTQDNN